MSRFYGNPVEDFPGLRLNPLRRHAERWVKKYSEVPIERIVLYHYSSKFQRYFDKRIKTKYAVVFEINEAEEECNNTEEERKIHLCKIRGKIPFTAYEQMVSATECPQCFRPRERLLALIDSDFDDVHEDKQRQPIDNLLDEWTFIPLLKDQQLSPSVRTDEPHLVLYPRESVEAPELVAKNHKCSFVLSCDVWKVRYDGESSNLRDLERMRYIVHLLENPGREFYAHELTRLVKGNEADHNQEYSKMAKKEGDEESRLEKEEGLSLVDDGAVEKLTEEDKDHFRNVAYQVWQELREARDKHSQEKIKKAQAAWERTKTVYADEHGISISETPEGPKLKFNARLKKDAEKARVNVRKLIKNAMEDIKNTIPSLGKHLKPHINTGMKCSYTPSEPIEWDIRWNS